LLPNLTDERTKMGANNGIIIEMCETKGCTLFKGHTSKKCTSKVYTRKQVRDMKWRQNNTDKIAVTRARFNAYKTKMKLEAQSK